MDVDWTSGDNSQKDATTAMQASVGESPSMQIADWGEAFESSSPFFYMGDGEGSGSSSQWFDPSSFENFPPDFMLYPDNMETFLSPTTLSPVDEAASPSTGLVAPKLEPGLEADLLAALKSSTSEGEGSRGKAAIKAEEAAAPATGKTRKPRTRTRNSTPKTARQSRDMHNEIEKQYRDRVNRQFRELLAVLRKTPVRGATTVDAGFASPSRVEILALAREKILAMEKENQTLDQNLKRLMCSVMRLQNVALDPRAGVSPWTGSF